MKKFVILGGGTAGWITAALLSRALLSQNNKAFEVCLVESENMGTIGVGEATIPPIFELLQFLNIDLEDFIAQTSATFKLGIEFVDWLEIGKSYFHPFGTLGPYIDNKPLFDHWQRLRLGGDKTELMELSINACLAQEGKFLIPNHSNKLSQREFGHALHFDAGLVAKYLAKYCEQKGVTHKYGNFSKADLDNSGNIAKLNFEDGTHIKGDFFFDCTGFSSRLIGGAFENPFIDWSDYLPCDTAIAVQTRAIKEIKPFTISKALTAGWKWQIPLQNRMGNGYVFSSKFIDIESAKQELLNSLPSETINEPSVIKFKAGRRKSQWVKNCLGIGLSSGFLEPLESTSIHLIMTGVYRFLDLFPNKLNLSMLSEIYNQRTERELEEIRDFLILHYCTTNRIDTEFWRYCAKMEIPKSLTDKLDLYLTGGKILSDFNDLFKPVSMISVLNGMGQLPKYYEPTIEAFPISFSKSFIERYREQLRVHTKDAITHEKLLEQICQRAKENA